MWLLVFLLIPSILAVDQETTINNHIVKINEGTLISVNPTPTSSFVLNLSGLGLRFLAENAFQNLTTLKNLDLGNNSLSFIPKQLFSNLGNLEHLCLADNNLTNFKKVFEGLDNLKTLNISNNPINSLQANMLSGLPRSSVVFTKGLSLEIINAYAFEREPETFFKTSAIPILLISNAKNPTKQAQNHNRLIKICIDGDVLKRVETLENNETLSSDCLRGELNEARNLLDLKNLGIANFEKDWYRLPDATMPIIQILFAGNNIVRVTPELINHLPRNVRNIDLGSNKIERLETDILDNRYIKVMDLRLNAIREIEDGAFTKMPRLSHLYLSDNLLNNTRFMATLPGKMRSLRVSRNKITEILPRSFSKHSSLQFLYLDGNLIDQVESDSLHGLRYLLELVLSDNHISKIEPESFQQLTNMHLMVLNNNNIFGFENGTFDNLRSLRYLHASHNKLSGIRESFPNGVPSNLAILNLGFNEIEKLKSGNFKNVLLTNLVLSGNKISEIEHGALELPTLRELNLDNNRLERLHSYSFCGLTNIDVLNLAYNSIASIPKRFTRTMDNLRELDLSYNPIHRLQNDALNGFRQTVYNKVFLRGVPIEIIEGGLFDNI